MALFGGKNKQLVGLDIGSSSIKAVELKSTKAGYELVSFGTEALAQDTVVDGAIMDAPQVANAISKIFDTEKIKTKNVATSVSGHSVIVKRVPLPSDDRRRAVRAHSFGSQPAHSVRHRRREPQLSAPRIDGRADGRAARRRQKRQNSESHERARTGRQNPGGRRYRRLRPAELL